MIFIALLVVLRALTVMECARSVKTQLQEVSSWPEALIRYIDKMGRRPLAAIGIIGMLVGLMRMPQMPQSGTGWATH